MNEKTSEDIYCLNCGNLTAQEKNFCVHCGVQLGETIVETTHSDSQPIQRQPVVVIHQQPQTPPQTQPQHVTVIKESNSNADAALLFAILGIFCLPFLGGCLAMLFGFFGAFKSHKRLTAIVSLFIGLATSGLWVIPLVMFVIPGIATGIWFWM